MTHQRLKYETFLQFKREIIQLRILGFLNGFYIICIRDFFRSGTLVYIAMIIFARITKSECLNFRRKNRIEI